jgi:hypothetical protein
MPLRVLVACEYSGRVRDAFARRGFDAWSCDYLPSDTPGKHYCGDIREILAYGWNILIAFPPCTNLAVSGAAWFKNKKAEQQAALDFVSRLMCAPIDKIAIENPIGVISSNIQRPDQIVQPFWFGDAYKKSTCLWLKNLPGLKPTNKVEPEYVVYNSRRTRTGKSRYSHFGKLGKGCGHERSITPLGLANAMAEQWGNVLAQTA